MFIFLLEILGEPVFVTSFQNIFLEYPLIFEYFAISPPSLPFYNKECLVCFTYFRQIKLKSKLLLSRMLFYKNAGSFIHYDFNMQSLTQELHLRDGSQTLSLPCVTR